MLLKQLRDQRKR